MFANVRTIVVAVASTVMVTIPIAVEAVAGVAVAIVVAVAQVRCWMGAASRARVRTRHVPRDIHGLGNVRRRHRTVIVIGAALVARHRLEYRAAGQQRGRR